MKPVQCALAGFTLIFVAACGADGAAVDGPDDGPDRGQKCDVDSTFAQVQQQIFEAQGCTASACHGDNATGGLDLRPDSAYASLVNVPGNSGDYMRVSPGEQDLSLLYQKVAAKTEDFELGPLAISGGAMPTGEGALSDDDLSLLRVWIRGGAPEDGIVAGSQQYASCELEGEVAPNKIQPLPAPAVDEGVQFYSGGWAVPAEEEGEVCFVTYYDYSETIPADFRIPCGEAEGGPDKDCFVFNKTLLAQDPQSHHSIIDFYVPPADKQNHGDPTDPVWKNWTCLGGDNDGTTCDPLGNDCGDRGQCATAPTTTIACIGYPNGPAEMGDVGGLFGNAAARQNLVLAQESSFRETLPTDVYAVVPVKGFIVWDSHAFNLTKSDTTIEQWLNFSFASPDALRYPRHQIFDADDIFGMGRIEAYSSKEACGSFTIPKHGRLLSLTTHTHRFGKEFRVWYPPNAPCVGDAPDNNCEPPTRSPDYVNYDYADPLYQRFSGDEIMKFDSDAAAERTFRYCAFWDNGESNPNDVRRESIKPDAQTCDFVGVFAPLANSAGLGLMACGCEPEERSCFGGPNEAMACNGDDSACGEGGVCDACPLGGGVTTEEEMFILAGSYYVETP